MKTKLLIGLALLTLLLLSGCKESYLPKYESQFIGLPDGDLICFTAEDYEERLKEEHRCVFWDKCESDYYTDKCDGLGERNKGLNDPELIINGDCR